MLSEYIAAALRKAHYEILAEDGLYYGEVPGLDGVWASAATLEECREELREVIEEWIALGLKLGHEIPAIDGLEVSVRTTI